jgi:hypothetical protein
VSFRKAIMQSNYDSVLDLAAAGRSAKLTIRLKVFLLPVDPKNPPPLEFSNPPQPIPAMTGATVDNWKYVDLGWVQDANGTPFQCRTWLQEEWNRFNIAFKRQVENIWNRQMVLLPPEEVGNGDGFNDQDYLQLISDPKLPAHVECALDIELANLHFNNKFPHQQNRPPIAIVQLYKREGGAFRSYARLMTNEDLEMRKHVFAQWPNITFTQLTAAHEISHNLTELDGSYTLHVDYQACKDDYKKNNTPPELQDPDCQYHRTQETAQSLSGVGNLFTDYEAQHWLNRVRRHTHVLFGWKTVLRNRLITGQVPVSDRQRSLLGGKRP